MRTRALAVAAFLASPLAVSAGSDSSVRCPGGLVGLGDAKIDLLGKCGAPALREGAGEVTTLLHPAAGGASVRAFAVPVERWTYDFGPQRFIVVVSLTGGRITGFESGGYGYAKVEPAAVPLPRAACEPAALRVGLTRLDVLARCGEPTLAERRDDLLRLVTDDRGGVVVTRTLAVAVEVWTYDFGPQSFVRFVTLEDGVVSRIETGSHGYAR